ncbi:hypothetical protein IMZ48_09725 [Candidatus Bathyarchaeota archaeon]|nr:hypothetical protein [Candidatus Bathyarchaeota archaeon]
MSRFFRGGDDSSSDSSSDEEEYSGEEEQQLAGDESEEESSEEEEAAKEESDDEDGKGGAGQFLKDADSESESDEEVRSKVKSAKTKRFDELESIIRLIDNARKIDDWGTIASGRHHRVPESGPRSHLLTRSMYRV